MVNPVDRTDGVPADDALLTAWLDGALSPEDRAAVDRRLASEPALRERLDLLTRGSRAFAPAYDALLAAAPTERLNALLAAAMARKPGSVAAAPASVSNRVVSALVAIAAAVVIFALGALAGYVVPHLTATPPEPPGWRQVVAEYYTLVTPESLAVIHDDPVGMQAELSAIGERLALPLNTDQLVLPDANLKRATYYDFRGRPLVQLAYLSDGGPISLCIITSTRPDSPVEFEQREGSNIVFWTKGGHGYMLIGKSATREELEAYAGDLAERFG